MTHPLLENLTPSTRAFCDQWLEAGYVPYEHPEFLRNHADVSLQKLIRSIHGKLFFIQVHVYRPYLSIPAKAYAEVQFNGGSGQDTFDVELYSARNPQQVEEFFSNIYLRMGCEPYERSE